MKVRGKSAIEEMHAGLAMEDEPRLDSRISEIYQVDSEEAAEIHANYHAERIIEVLQKRAAQKGMHGKRLEEITAGMDVRGIALQVAAGKVAEAAAVDILFRSVYIAESNGQDNDRYVNFYG